MHGTPAFRIPCFPRNRDKRQKIFRPSIHIDESSRLFSSIDQFSHPVPSHCNFASQGSWVLRASRY